MAVGVAGDVEAEPVRPGLVAWGYRPALDGLRMVAVYLVVAFHAGVGRFDGGFIGVDLFFVLSGFLMTNVLLGELDGTGRLRLARFYARRVRRLLPAAAFAAVGACLMFVVVAPIAQRGPIVDDARSAMLYYSNWHFLQQSSDYFGADSVRSPFLHFWSLSIEEQFYLLFPVTLVGLAALARRSARRMLVPIGLATLGAVSLAAQLYWAQENPLRAYYGTDARLYQLLAGAALAAVLRRRSVSSASAPTAPFAGPLALGALGALVMTATSIVSWSPSTRGIAAMVCSVALIGALELHHGSRTARVLATRVPTYLGRVSYSTYLWHWPIIVTLARVVRLGPMATLVVAATAATAMACLSDQLFELAIRRSRRLDRWKAVVIAGGLALSLLVGLVIAPAILHSQRRSALITRPGAGAPNASRTPITDAIDGTAAKNDIAEIPQCQNLDPEGCVVVPGAGFKIHLVGDSLAASVMPLFEQVARDRGWQLSVSIYGGCPWQYGLRYQPLRFGNLPRVSDLERWQRCDELQPDWYDRVIPALAPDVVVLWNRAFDNAWPVAATDRELASSSQERIVERLSEETTRRLVDGGHRVVIVEPIPGGVVPPTNVDPATCLSDATYIEECAFTTSTRTSPTERLYRRLDRESDRITTLDLDRLVCPDSPVCLPVIRGMVVRRDHHHLTATFARSLAAPVAPLLGGP